jgi:hypothetical protein
MKKLKIIFSVLFLFAFYACSKDQNPEPIDPNALKYRVKEIRDASNVLISSFEYNNQNLVTRLNTSNDYSVFTYNAAGYLLKEENKDNNGNINYTIDYILNANNALTERIKKSNNTFIEKWVYVNNAAKLPISARKYNYVAGAWQIDDFMFEDNTYDSKNRLLVNEQYDYRYNYTYDANSNLVEIKKYNINGGRTEYLLVQKTATTYNNVKPAYYLNSSLSKNSPIQIITSEYDDGAFMSSSTENYNYDFNPSKYITKSYKNGQVDLVYTLEKF